jgi:hypothetical protein
LLQVSACHCPSSATNGASLGVDMGRSATQPNPRVPARAQLRMSRHTESHECNRQTSSSVRHSNPLTTTVCVLPVVHTEVDGGGWQTRVQLQPTPAWWQTVPCNLVPTPWPVKCTRRWTEEVGLPGQPNRQQKRRRRPATQQLRSLARVRQERDMLGIGLPGDTFHRCVASLFPNK